MQAPSLRKFIHVSLFVLFAGGGTTVPLASRAEVAAGTTVPAEPLAETPDSLGESLQRQMIWAPPGSKPRSAYLAFRKRFTLAAVPDQASLSLFADVRYLLWINGSYVLRGPARFDPKGPEYDVAEVRGLLRAGDNEIVVLVLANQSNGKMMHHPPGLTLQLDGKSAGQTRTLLITDETWKWSDGTRYRTPNVKWGNVGDVIDSTVEDGDWTQPAYQDAGWKTAVHIDGKQWGALSARRIPLLRATPVEVSLKDHHSFPVTVATGQELGFTVPRLVQACTVLDFEADPDTTFVLPDLGITYKAKAGRQLYITSDTHGFTGGSLKVTQGKLTLHSLKAIELIYPFDCAGSFESSDPMLNKLWALCARSLQVTSEDAYVDCADRERTEWMDCDPPAFDITRTAMTGPGRNGAPVDADPRLLKEMLRRTALTLQPGDWVKAHTCSDRFDIHAKMEDRACDWVEGARRYYDSAGDAALIKEIWPAITAQMRYFLDRRTPRGLVLAREWVVWGNPMGYQVCEGTALNAFIYKALVDAAYLGRVIGENEAAATFGQAAKDLARAVNTVLWDDADGTYYSGYCPGTNELPPGTQNRKLNLAVKDGLAAPTVYPALFALDQEIVPADRLPRVTSYLLGQQGFGAEIMFYYYYFKQLYRVNQPAQDEKVLAILRAKWKAMTDWPWQTTWENFNGGSKAHGYGMLPGYFLSSYVLGVRLDGPARNKHLLIEPRLGDLVTAKGTVVTELNLVRVAWEKGPTHLNFKLEVPAGSLASLRLPSHGGKATLVLDDRPFNTPHQEAGGIAADIGRVRTTAP